MGPEFRTPRKTQVAGISREKGVGEGKKKKKKKSKEKKKPLRIDPRRIFG